MSFVMFLILALTATADYCSGNAPMLLKSAFTRLTKEACLQTTAEDLYRTFAEVDGLTCQMMTPSKCQVWCIQSEPSPQVTLLPPLDSYWRFCYDDSPGAPSSIRTSCHFGHHPLQRRGSSMVPVGWALLLETKVLCLAGALLDTSIESAGYLSYLS